MAYAPNFVESLPLKATGIFAILLTQDNPVVQKQSFKQ